MAGRSKLLPARVTADKPANTCEATGKDAEGHDIRTSITSSSPARARDCWITCNPYAIDVVPTPTPTKREESTLLVKTAIAGEALVTIERKTASAIRNHPRAGQWRPSKFRYGGDGECLRLRDDARGARQPRKVKAAEYRIGLLRAKIGAAWQTNYRVRETIGAFVSPGEMERGCRSAGTSRQARRGL